MATEVQNGRATLYGIGNNGSAITIEGYASFTLDSVKVNRKWDMEALKDENNFDCALIWTNGHDECDIAFIVSGSTLAGAAGTATFLAPGFSVSIDGFRASVCNGTWISLGDQSLDLTKKEAKMMLKVRKYVDTTQNTALSTTVS